MICLKAAINWSHWSAFPASWVDGWLFQSGRERFSFIMLFSLLISSSSLCRSAHVLISVLHFYGFFHWNKLRVWFPCASPWLQLWRWPGPAHRLCFPQSGSDGSECLTEQRSLKTNMEFGFPPSSRFLDGKCLITRLEPVMDLQSH